MSQDKDWSQRQLQIFKAIADNAGAVIGAKDLDGRYLYVNQQYSRLFCRPLSDFIGHTDAELFPAEIAAKFRRADLMAQRASQAFSVEEVVPVDGLEKDFLSIKFPIAAEDGTLFATGLVAADISKIKDLQRQLQTMADHDVLTSCYNRRKVLEIAAIHLKKAKRYQQEFSVLVFDLDHFKQVNDTFGHAVGDCVLIGFVERVNAELRKPDELGRLGGEEFIAILPDTSAEAATALAERIRSKIASWFPAAVQGQVQTCSIGIAGYSLSLQSLDEVVAAADHAMYQAKANGRNCVRSY
ncbi:MAG: GGDEF domain-containing protein [Gammaproteobacteria bacterium]|jgi:diguanylate cyclase (GGDEF)-like protein/PAS domain S-box-containing protein|nr:GGDEF domain-containing protein [Gammaproteobacteria bacterium]MBU2224950.1 GGDEF domain-containing protein [Gammaproteobacteria bacterium]MBU2427153.1 GGDEF domain-containing protein [Gammaproteobacteria bacterium]